jgi:nitroreductase
MHTTWNIKIASPSLERCLYECSAARRFVPEPVSVAVLQNLLECAVQPFSPRSAQPWRFHVLGAKTTQALAGLAHQVTLEVSGANAAGSVVQMLETAPRLVAVSAECRYPNKPRCMDEDYAAVCCAIQNLTLAAHAKGYSVWWRTGALVRDSRTHALLQLESNERLVGILHIGKALRNVPKLAKSAPSKTRWLE